MFGPPDDKPGECNARLFLGDDYGDNTCTIRCGLLPDHDGNHREVFTRGTSGKVNIAWAKDERHICTWHGIQPWRDCTLCDDAPVMCSVHGMQEFNFCSKCSDEIFVCPDHGAKGDNRYSCLEEGCKHDIDERWTKVYNARLPDDPSA